VLCYLRITCSYELGAIDVPLAKIIGISF
jgi:hypothetical protein